MHENDATREKGSTDSGLRSILTVTRGCTFFFFARCRSLAAAWRVLVAVVSSRRRFERKRAKCAWPVARPVGWLPYQANRFSSTNRGVAIETREVTYLSNSRTADSFLASALCGGAIGKPNFGFPRARIRDIEPSV